MNILEYLSNNKEWIFSGVGVAVISWLFSKKVQVSRMKQNSGKNSTNIQVGGNFEIKDRDDHGPK